MLGLGFVVAEIAVEIWDPLNAMIEMYKNVLSAIVFRRTMGFIYFNILDSN